MKLELVTVYDKRAKEYSPPQGYQTLGVAERAFSDAVNTKDSHLNKHPYDYNLQHIGCYDTETAVITMNSHGPHIVCEATSVDHNQPE